MYSLKSPFVCLINAIYEKNPEIIFEPIVEPADKIAFALQDILNPIQNTEIKELIKKLILKYYANQIIKHISSLYNIKSITREIEYLIDHLF